MASQVEIDWLNQFGFDDGPATCRDCDLCVRGGSAFWRVGDEDLRGTLDCAWGICTADVPSLVELDRKGCA